MGVIQIVILIVGAIFFTVSFFVPDRQNNTKENREKEEKLIREILEQEMNTVRFQMEEAASDTVEHTKETTQRYMDRLTNEKMMAVSEYSDTVLEQIHKNHEEAMFLYDMLNNKHAQIKNTAAEINDTVKNVRQVSKEVAAPAKAEAVEPVKKLVKAETLEEADTLVKAVPSFEPITPKKITLTEEQKKQISDVPQKQGKTAKTKKSTTASKKTGDVEVSFGTDMSGMNNNDRILALHKEGKSNMAIARELSLGIGEVKLVIDLFEGI